MNETTPMSDTTAATINRRNATETAGDPEKAHWFGLYIPYFTRGICSLWGARAILKKPQKIGGDWNFALLYDRQQMRADDPEEKVEALAHWLQETALPALRTRVAHGTPGVLNTEDSCDTVVLHDGAFHLAASPRGSFGYLYLCAWEDADPRPYNLMVPPATYEVITYEERYGRKSNEVSHGVFDGADGEAHAIAAAKAQVPAKGAGYTRVSEGGTVGTREDYGVHGLQMPVIYRVRNAPRGTEFVIRAKITRADPAQIIAPEEVASRLLP